MTFKDNTPTFNVNRKTATKHKETTIAARIFCQSGLFVIKENAIAIFLILLIISLYKFYKVFKIIFFIKIILIIFSMINIIKIIIL